MAGDVYVQGQRCDKAGTRFAEDVAIELRGDELPYASRGGLKLEAALEAFAYDVTDRVVIDVGASTGGFTDCVLQRGAARVYAVDVGYGQLAWKLRQDDRVVVMERTNARHLDRLPETVDLIVGDLSFISLTHILPAIARLVRPGGDCVLLIKPQFEAGRDGVGSGGVVRDPEVRAAAIARVLSDATARGFTRVASIPSPVAGAKKGNIEELVHLTAPLEPT